MDTKAAFEKWAKEEVLSLDVFSRGENKGVYKSKITRDCWDAWQASRAAIEIELPRKVGSKSSWQDGPFMFSDEVVDELTSHGIIIKGKTE